MNVVLIQTGKPDARLLDALGAQFQTAEISASDAGEGAGAAALDLVELERRFTDAPPDALVLAGDDMPAVEVALVAAKLQIPIVRVGAGADFVDGAPARLLVSEGGFGRVSDRLATLLLCAGEPEQQALAAAGLGDRTLVVGADPERVVAALRERLGLK
ncbi:MAG: UDP-N-acetylglucosamine 2-epimerase [Solirubrobacterales bacterium]